MFIHKIGLEDYTQRFQLKKLFSIIIFNHMACFPFKVTLMKSFDVELHPNITVVESRISKDLLFPNTFESRVWGSGMKMLYSFPLTCAEALTEFHRLKLDVKNYDLLMIEMFSNECFYDIIDEVR